MGGCGKWTWKVDVEGGRGRWAWQEGSMPTSFLPSSGLQRAVIKRHMLLNFILIPNDQLSSFKIRNNSLRNKVDPQTVEQKSM